MKAPNDGGYLSRRLAAPATDPAAALKRVREALAVESEKAERTHAAIDEVVRLVAELEILCIRQVRLAREAGVTEGQTAERARCARIADEIGRGSMSGVAAQISNLIRKK